MSRRPLILVLLAAIACAGVGAYLTGALTTSSADFGWTAYAPLSAERYAPLCFTPIHTAWQLWAPRIGVGLLAIGAGSAGSIAAALLITPRTRTGTSAPLSLARDSLDGS